MYSSYVFPSNLESSNGNNQKTNHPYIHIILYNWQVRSKNSTTPSGKAIPISDYILALPETTIQEQYNHEWAQGIDPSRLIGGGISGVAKKVFAALAEKSKTLDTMKSVFETSQGKLMNDFVAMNYGGIDFRQFEFLFNMIPKDQTEAYMIYEILKSLKKHTTPTYENLVVDFPCVATFKVYSGGLANSKPLFQSQFCGVQTLGMNYSPSGFMRTFEDGFPVQVHLNISFKELQRVQPEVLD